MALGGTFYSGACWRGFMPRQAREVFGFAEGSSRAKRSDGG